MSEFKNKSKMQPRECLAAFCYCIEKYINAWLSSEPLLLLLDNSLILY